MKIKNLREVAGLSISDLAEATMLTSQELELVEQNQAVPPISALVKISKALGVRLGTILDGDECCAPVVMNPSQAGAGTDFKLSVNLLNKPHLTYHLLAKGKSDRNMEPSLIEVDYMAPEDAVFAPHEGEEFLYVLEGEIVVGYGKEIFRVQAGQSIYYDSVVPHYLSSASAGQRARILAVAYMPIG